jgi:membrane-associated phospholipid phosphatase
VKLQIFCVILTAVFAIGRGSAQTDTRPDLPVPATTTEMPHQNPFALLPAGEDPDNRLGAPFIEHLALDQKQFWTAPFHVDRQDARIFFPFVAFTGALIAGDSWISRQVPGSASEINRSKKISDYATYSMIGAAGASYFWGHFTQDDHLRETGFLAGEAALDSTAVAYLLKTMTQRPRPLADNGNGTFFHGGGSFPSEHSAVAWSVASVVAHEYPGTLTKIGAYGLASVVTLTRVTGKQHFPSDVVVGSALGWYFARQVYRAHHDTDLGGAGWENPAPAAEVTERASRPANMGSPFVPLDSWVYPAFDRLIALGYVRSAIQGMRPWTRLECVRLLDEASDLLNSSDAEMADRGAFQIYESLAEEFSHESSLLEGGKNQDLQVDSFYTRATGISGAPLTDGYHFGQTILNDYGRPYSEGFNAIDGFSGSAAAGPVTAYLRGEYQHAPATPALSQQARQFLESADWNGVPLLPEPPDVGSPAVDRFQQLDAYVAVNIEDWQLSFGKQSLWWGPSEGGPMMFSDNAVPVTMLRIDRVTPFHLPWLFGLMGPTRWEFFLGRLSGHDFVFGYSTGVIGQWGVPLSDQPFMAGQKLNFRPTPNFEFGIDYTRITAGAGQPFTFRQFLRSVFSHGSGQPGNLSNPGDGQSGVDFSYKLPGLRRWLTFYGDAFTADEYSPLNVPRKAVFQGGIYLPRLPGLPKLDLRVEGGSTSPPDFPTCDGCFYSNDRFLNAYTNQGNLMGSWVGRASQGEQAWSKYWLTSRNTIQFNYRHRKLDAQWIPNGGTVNDAGVKADYWLGKQMRLSASLQYEKWQIPLLSSSLHSNLTTSVELGFWPRNLGAHNR